MSLILLSTPYTHPDPFVKEERVRITLAMVAHLIEQEVFVFSPIVYGTHIINSGHALPDDWKFWQKYCEACVTSSAGFIYVLDLDGWDRSTGVLGEIAEAKRQGKQVFLIALDLDGPLEIIREL